MSCKILIIEDYVDDFNAIYDTLTDCGYECYPTKDQYTKFRTSFFEYLRKLDDTRYHYGLQQLEEQLSIKYNVIILDMSLLPSENDKSGLSILRLIRSNDVYTPVILLTKHRFDFVSKAFESADCIANYYLCKEETLTASYINDSLSPVLSMLLYWQSLYRRDKDILELIKENDNKLIDIIDQRFGIIINSLDEICKTTNELVIYSTICLRSIQRSVQKRDKKSYEFISELINQYKLCNNIDEVKYCSIRESIEKSKDLIIDKIIDGSFDEVVDIVKEQLQSYLEIDEDSLLKISSTLIIKAVSGAWKFYRTGDI